MALRMKVIAALGGKCQRCDFADYRALQVDHIHGGGSWEFRTTGWPAFYRRVLETLEKEYQLLCANCNQIKKHENGEHSRGRPRGSKNRPVNGYRTARAVSEVTEESVLDRLTYESE